MRMKQLSDGSLQLWLSADDTYNWAHKAGAAWPCSQLSGHRLFACFESNGDLIDYTVDGRFPADDIDATEFNAITSDFIRSKYPDHEAIKLG